VRAKTLLKGSNFFIRLFERVKHDGD